MLLNNKRNRFISWWFTPVLPRQYIEVSKGSGIKTYILKWLVHPIKRRIAKGYLILLRKCFGLRVIGITGSAGKTTTKEMIASVLSQDGRTVWSKANIDPVYNIPSTILRCLPNTKYLVLEMGVEYPGEMDYYLWLAKPDVGVITNIFFTHTLYMGSLSKVREEKSKLVRMLSGKDFAVLNAGDNEIRKIKSKVDACTIWFGQNGFVKATNVKCTLTGTYFTLNIGTDKNIVHMPIVGSQFVNNALAAASVGHIFNLDIDKIVKGISIVNNQDHRMNIIKHKSGAVIIDDSYNSNPLALKETLKTFTELARAKKKVAVLGDMLELGEYEEKFHKELGEDISLMGMEFLIGVGKASKVMVDEAKTQMGEKKVIWYSSVRGVEKSLKPFLKKDSVILIKGSRSIGLDQLVSLLRCV